MNTQNALPRFDGDLTPYGAEPLSEADRWAIHVNGVNTSPEGHLAGASAIAQVIEGTCLGVYNQTGPDGILNIVEPAKLILELEASPSTPGPLKLILNGVRLAFDALESTADIATVSLFAFLENTMPVLLSEPWRLLVVRAALARNPPTLALFDLLYEKWSAPAVHLVPYSQGNWLTANALFALKAVKAQAIPQNFFIYSIASPVHTWPQALPNHKLYTNTNDPITWLSLGESYKQGSVTFDEIWEFPSTHDINRYIEETQFGSDIRGNMGLDEFLAIPPSEEGSRLEGVPSEAGRGRPLLDYTDGFMKKTRDPRESIQKVGSSGSSYRDHRLAAEKARLARVKEQLNRRAPGYRG